MGNTAQKTLLLVAAKTGYQTREFAARAEALGYGLQLATDRCGHLDDQSARGVEEAQERVSRRGV